MSRTMQSKKQATTNHVAEAARWAEASPMHGKGVLTMPDVNLHDKLLSSCE
jgi:hypothetical protein